MVKVNVKWGKEAYAGVEADPDQPPSVFKLQLFSLTGVPPERQKVMIKGALLKDDEWGRAAPKEGAAVMMMGSADPLAAIEAPKNAPVFVEDLPEEEQDALATRHVGCGLENLGNTCYMNSTVQFLYSVPALRDALKAGPIGGGGGGSGSGAGAAAAAAAAAASAGVGAAVAAAPPVALPPAAVRVASAARELFSDLARGGAPFAPMGFLMALRAYAPQFAQQGEGGAYSQQDAEECLTKVLQCLRAARDAQTGRPAADALFGVHLLTRLACEESGETRDFPEEIAYALKCNIAGDTSHLSQGLELALKADREMASEKLGGRTVPWTGSSRLVGPLPPHLPVQLVRFFFKADVQQKAKILRRVAFPLELDAYELCADELKRELDGPRAAFRAWADAKALAGRAGGAKKEGGDGAAGSGAAAASAAGGSGGGAAAEAGAGAAAAAAAAVGGDAEMEDAAAAAAEPPARSPHAGALTGRYELTAVLTHKGRSADSGHYVAWVKQPPPPAVEAGAAAAAGPGAVAAANGKGKGAAPPPAWFLFDDDKITPKTAEEVLNLAGGGDWHMAYLLMYTAVRVPEDAPAVVVAAKPEEAAGNGGAPAAADAK
jgi:ubiquitin carboxyl-terminal hydrolase 14